MISKQSARDLDAAMAKEAKRPDYGRSVISREDRANQPRRGVCYICGCKVHRTETICGECACEDDCAPDRKQPPRIRREAVPARRGR